MGSLSLLARAKEVARGKGVMTALAIAPLAMALEVKADAVFLTTPDPTFRTASGGRMGHIAQAGFTDLLTGQKGVYVTGDTHVGGVDGITADLYPENVVDGDVTAHHVATNNGQVIYDWGKDFDGSESLTGAFNGGLLFVGHDFSLSATGNDVGLTWKLTASVSIGDGDFPTYYNYELDSSGHNASGSFSGVSDPIALPAGNLRSWSMHLEIDWNVGTNGFVIGVNDNDRLTVDILGDNADSEGPATFMRIDELAGAASEAPLPATFWASSSLLGLFGIGRFRKSRRK